MKNIKRRLLHLAMPMASPTEKSLGLHILKTATSYTFILFNTKALTAQNLKGKPTDVYLVLANAVYGMITLKHNEDDNTTWYVKAVVANHGYGPLLYRIAMSRVIKDGKPWVGPDSDVTRAARKIWHFFYQDASVERRKTKDRNFWPRFEEASKQYRVPIQKDDEALRYQYRLRSPLNLEILKSRAAKLFENLPQAKDMIVKRAKDRWFSHTEKDF